MSLQELLAKAKNGCAVSQYELGRRYFCGIGTEANESEGIKWIEIAAKKGHGDALYNLGYIHATGTTAEQANEGTQTFTKEKESTAQRDDSEVDSPKHYTQGGIECIDAIEAALTPDEFRGYCKGNVIKYTWRERHKGGMQSLKKAHWYLEKLESGECNE